MKVSVDQLEEGDEIIISSYSELKYLRVLKKPELSKTRTHWRTKLPLFKSVKLLACKTEKVGGHGYKYYGFDLDPDNLNTVIYKDLHGRDIWLVKKGNKSEI